MSVGRECGYSGLGLLCWGGIRKEVGVDVISRRYGGLGCRDWGVSVGRVG